jgi:hypothetical protein
VKIDGETSSLKGRIEKLRELITTYTLRNSASAGVGVDALDCDSAADDKRRNSNNNNKHINNRRGPSKRRGRL